MLILASNSPRRKELLSLITTDFIVRVADVDETLPEGISPKDAVLYLSKLKSSAVFNGVDTVLGADTIVVLDGEILGKPRDDDEAFSMLRALSGRKHSVFTGVTILGQNGACSFYRETEVYFNGLSDEEIWDYIKTGECRDKAGAYGIQGYGSRFVEKISGDYFNVVGLPVSAVYQALKELEFFVDYNEN